MMIDADSEAPVSWRQGWGAALVIALQFLTRIPTPDIGLMPGWVVGRSLLCYPLVGGVIGALLGGLSLLLDSWLAGAYGVQAALLLASWCLLTGGLHLDGLADSADAWVGGLGDRERTLRLMKDPTCGPAAVMLVGLLLLVKFAALEQLLSQASLWWLAVPVFGRALVLLLFVTTPYVREGGLASALTDHLPRSAAWWLLVLLGLAGWLLLGVAWLVLFGVAGVVFFALRRLMMDRLGGTTGDTTGALIELAEGALLVAAVAL